MIFLPNISDITETVKGNFIRPHLSPSICSSTRRNRMLTSTSFTTLVRAFKEVYNHLGEYYNHIEVDNKKKCSHLVVSQ